MHFLCLTGPQCTLSDTNGGFYPLFHCTPYIALTGDNAEHILCSLQLHLNIHLGLVILLLFLNYKGDSIFIFFFLLSSVIALFALKYPQTESTFSCCFEEIVLWRRFQSIGEFLRYPRGNRNRELAFINCLLHANLSIFTQEIWWPAPLVLNFLTTSLLDWVPKAWFRYFPQCDPSWHRLYCLPVPPWQLN